MGARQWYKGDIITQLLLKLVELILCKSWNKQDGYSRNEEKINGT